MNRDGFTTQCKNRTEENVHPLTFNSLILLRITLNTLTNSIDFIRQLSGTEGTRVLGDALVKQVDDVAIPASLPKGDKNNDFYISCNSLLGYSQSPNTHTVSE